MRLLPLISHKTTFGLLMRFAGWLVRTIPATFRENLVMWLMLGQANGDESYEHYQ